MRRIKKSSYSGAWSTAEIESKTRMIVVMFFDIPISNSLEISAPSVEAPSAYFFSTIGSFSANLVAIFTG
jgi:hypothetical protein